MYCLSHFIDTYTNLTLDLQAAMLYSYNNPSTSLEQFANAFCQPFSFDGELGLTGRGDHSGMLDGCCCWFGLVECLDCRCFRGVNFPEIDYHAPHQWPLLLAELCLVMSLNFPHRIRYLSTLYTYKLQSD